jgi:hypothetical protein
MGGIAIFCGKKRPAPRKAKIPFLNLANKIRGEPGFKKALKKRLSSVREGVENDQKNRPHCHCRPEPVGVQEKNRGSF